MKFGVNKLVWSVFHRLDYGIIEKRNKYLDGWIKQALLNIESGKKILDAGAGESQYKKYCQHLVYTAQDFGQYDGIGNGQGKQTGSWDNTCLDIVSDIIDIPEPDESYDAILCTEVFQHIPEPIAALKEFSRLLKKSGVLILTVPVCSMTHFAPYYFYNGYSRYFFEKYLPLFGFSIKEITFNGNYFDYLAQMFRGVCKFSNRYSKISKFESYFFLMLTPFILKHLAIFSHNDQGSNELISYGMHIVAEKN